MLSKPLEGENAAIVKLAQWFQTPAGQYIHQWEQARLDAAVDDVFGYNAVQAGLPVWPALRKSRMPFRAFAGPTIPETGMQEHWNALVTTALEDLPFASQSLDLYVLPHGLEYSHNPHQVLREAERVLIPKGRLVITGFNPWSLWGLRQRVRGSQWMPDCARFISIARLKDWLTLLSFDLDRGHFGRYALPVNSQKWLDRCAFLEKAGDRWWPVAGSVYIVSAVKRVHGMRLVGPSWKTETNRAKRGQMAVHQRVKRSASHFPPCNR